MSNDNVKNLTVGAKLSKVNDCYNVSLYDNGYMVEISGQDKSGDYKTAKIICNELSELLDIVAEISKMERC